MKLRAKPILLTLLALGVLAGAAFLFLTRGPMAPAKATAARVERGDLAPQIFGIGSVEARRSYLIGPTLASRVSRVLVDHGDVVRAGQLLAELDPVDLDERMVSAGNALQRAASTTEVAAAQAREARSRNALAEASAQRFRELRQKGFVSQEAADAKQHEANAARAALEAADAAHAAARRDYAKLAADQAGVGKQRAQYRLLSPVDGQITARDAEPGSTVVAGQTVLRLIDPTSLWVKARIDQGRALGIAIGQRAEIVLRSRPDEPLPGKVARVEALSDAVTEERLVQVAFDAPPKGWSIGELVEVTISLPAAKNALYLPSAAVKRLQHKTGVWQLEAGKPKFTPIRTGVQTLDGRTQVVDGLAQGDEVIVHTLNELRGGEKLRVVSDLPQGGA